MMENAIKGRHPDFTVSASVLLYLHRLQIPWERQIFVNCILKCVRWYQSKCGKNLINANNKIQHSIVEINFITKKLWNNLVFIYSSFNSWKVMDFLKAGEVQMKSSIKFLKLKNKDQTLSRLNVIKLKKHLIKWLKKLHNKHKIWILKESSLFSKKI